ncbi:hypothetical protein [Kineococcus glutinatus]|uniref:Uncharacterized protein n=1 Tax=Kineococcus glutinatus TaxID=1070872 RepID=A0ABP9HUK4_9ACTN
MDERRGAPERRKLVDLTRAERGEPERRAMPGVERRDLEQREPPLPDDTPDDTSEDRDAPERTTP